MTLVKNSINHWAKAEYHLVWSCLNCRLYFLIPIAHRFTLINAIPGNIRGYIVWFVLWLNKSDNRENFVCVCSFIPVTLWLFFFFYPTSFSPWAASLHVRAHTERSAAPHSTTWTPVTRFSLWRSKGKSWQESYSSLSSSEQPSSCSLEREFHYSLIIRRFWDAGD